jgi:hypothetical protein
MVRALGGGDPALDPPARGIYAIRPMYLSKGRRYGPKVIPKTSRFAATLIALVLLLQAAPAFAQTTEASGAEDHSPRIRINFQPTGSPLACGFLPDYGYVFGDRNGLKYGWNVDHTDVTRDRGINSDQRLDTLSHFHRASGWGIALPHGDHEITVTIGDAEYASTHSLNVEGTNFWHEVNLRAGQFLTKTETVHVDDGILLLHQGWADEKATRINSIAINADNTPDGCGSPEQDPTPTETPTPASTTRPSPTPTKPPSVSPSPTPVPSASPEVPLEPNPDGPFARINFQLEGSPTVCGYGPDYGYTFNEREYWASGWNFDHTDQARDRGVRDNQLLDTLNHFHAGGKWEFAVPNGVHQVRVGIGDPSVASEHTINVEGVNYWDDFYLEANDMRRQAHMITVTDGRITIDQGNARDASTRITHVEINADGAPDWCKKSSGGDGGSSEPDGPTTTGGSGTVGSRPYGVKGLRAVFGKPCNTRSNNARSYFPSAAGRGRSGYVYYHSKLAKKIGGNVLKKIYRQNKKAALDYGIWGYACRMKTGGSSWSVHSWGAAIDTNTLRNPWQARKWDGRGSNGKRYGRYLPDLYLRQGFYWGIHFRDPMHFQYVSGY